MATALMSAMEVSESALVVIEKKSTLVVDLPERADPAAHLTAVQDSVCAGKAAGCSVRVVEGRGRRRLGSQTTFEISIPANATDSLSSNAADSSQLTNLLTSSLASALGMVNVTVAAPIVSLISVTITVTLEGSVEDAAAATQTFLNTATITASLASELGVSESLLSVTEAVVAFPPRPPPGAPPPSPLPLQPPSAPPSLPPACPSSTPKTPSPLQPGFKVQHAVELAAVLQATAEDFAPAAQEEYKSALIAQLALQGVADVDSSHIALHIEELRRIRRLATSGTILVRATILVSTASTAASANQALQSVKASDLSSLLTNIQVQSGSLKAQVITIVTPAPSPPPTTPSPQPSLPPSPSALHFLLPPLPLQPPPPVDATADEEAEKGLPSFALFAAAGGVGAVVMLVLATLVFILCRRRRSFAGSIPQPPAQSQLASAQEDERIAGPHVGDCSASCLTSGFGDQASKFGAEASRETNESKHRLSFSSAKVGGSRFTKHSQSFCDDKMALPSRRSLVERPPTARSKAKGSAILPNPAVLPRPSNEDRSCEDRVKEWFSATEQTVDIRAKVHI